MEQNSADAKHITILTGFLGSGKTTFLNEWIRYQSGKRILVIENEVGEVNIDAQLIKNVELDAIYTLTGGCICCGINDDFSELLVDLWSDKDSFDEIIVEATGIADPQQLLVPFKARKSMSNFYKVDRVICLIDIHFIESELQNTEIAKKQIIGSDILLLSKTDQISHINLSVLKKTLQEINPFALILDGNKLEGFPLKPIDSYYADQSKWYNTSLPFEPSEGKIRLRKRDQHAITTLHFSFKDPFDLDELKYRLLIFLNFQAADIYRIKGILSIEDSDDKIIVQTVADILSFDTSLKWAENEPRKSDIVIIGKNLLSKGFEKMLANCIHHRYTSPT